MNPVTHNGADVDIGIVGGNTYGQDPTISDERTFNMIVSDGHLVTFGGYEIAAPVSESSVGRALFTSERLGAMIAVIGNRVFGLRRNNPNSEQLQPFTIGNIDTFEGDVFIDENIAGEIAICDGRSIWIYNHQSPTNPPLIEADLPIDDRTGERIIPGYITYQNGYFIAPNSQSASWFLSAPNDGTNWNWSATSGPVTTSIQTKSTNAVAALRAPGRGNLLYLFGRNVTEFWTDVGQQIFPYQRSSTTSIDYGCISANTIATLDDMVAWLGFNEKSGAAIMVSRGSDYERISTDGIDFELARLTAPEDSRGFFYRFDGHIYYQITFITDNFTLIYDFNTKTFFSLTDEFMNRHIAESIAFFDNRYYFCSLVDGFIYRLSSDVTVYDYRDPETGAGRLCEIPQVRIPKTQRRADNARFRTTAMTFNLKQGDDKDFVATSLFTFSTEDGFALALEDDETLLQTERTLEPYQPKILLSVSRDGAESFGNYIERNMPPLGNRRNRILFTQLGSGNEFTPKIRFATRSRVVASEGVMTLTI